MSLTILFFDEIFFKSYSKTGNSSGSIPLVLWSLTLFMPCIDMIPPIIFWGLRPLFYVVPSVIKTNLINSNLLMNRTSFKSSRRRLKLTKGLLSN
jgi:hypothetical protein